MVVNLKLFQDCSEVSLRVVSKSFRRSLEGCFRLY